MRWDHSLHALGSFSLRVFFSPLCVSHFSLPLRPILTSHSQVRSVEVHVKRSKDTAPELLFAVRREEHGTTAPATQPGTAAPATQPGVEAGAGDIMGFIRGDGRTEGAGDASKGAFYRRLQSTDTQRLPRESRRLRLHVTTGGGGAREVETGREGVAGGLAAVGVADGGADGGEAHVGSSLREAEPRASEERVEEWLVCR